MISCCSKTHSPKNGNQADRDQARVWLIIKGAISISLLLHVIYLKDPKKMWDTLRDIAEPDANGDRRYNLRRRMESLRPLPGKPLYNFFSNMQILYEQLKGTEDEVTEMAVKNMIFRAIPHSDRIIMTNVVFTSQELTDLSLQKTISRLLLYSLIEEEMKQNSALLRETGVR
jgi:hypothetical protein